MSRKDYEPAKKQHFFTKTVIERHPSAYVFLSDAAMGKINTAHGHGSDLEQSVATMFPDCPKHKRLFGLPRFCIFAVPMQFSGFLCSGEELSRGEHS